MRFAWWIALALVFAADRPAWACSCVPASPCAQFNGTDAVFLGRVIDIRLERNVSWVRMEVVRTYKGDVDESVTVSNGAGDSCSFRFMIGQRFLVFGSGAGQTFSTHMCAGGGPLAPGAPEPDLPPPAGRVDGRLVHFNRNFTSLGDATTPAAGVRVWIETSSGAIDAKTDATGAFRLDGVPAGPHVVRADVGPALEGVTSVNLRSSSDCGTVLIMTRASGRIAGMLRSAAAAVGGVEVYAVPVGHDWSSRDLSDTRRATANPDGSFDLSGLEPGKYWVTVNVVSGPTVRHPFAPTYYPGVGTREEAVVVEVAPSRALSQPLVLEKTLPSTTMTVEIVCQDGSSPRSGSVRAVPAGSHGFAIESTYKMVDGRFPLQVIAGLPYDVGGSLGVPLGDADGRETGIRLVPIPSVRVEPGSTSAARLVAPLNRCHEITRD